MWVGSVILLGSFATLLLLHGWLVLLLFRRRPPGPVALAALLPPVAWLAPYWAFRHGARRLGVAWLIALTVYGLSLVWSLSFG